MSEKPKITNFGILFVVLLTIIILSAIISISYFLIGNYEFAEISIKFSLLMIIFLIWAFGLIFLFGDDLYD